VLGYLDGCIIFAVDNIVAIIAASGLVHYKWLLRIQIVLIIWQFRLNDAMLPSQQKLNANYVITARRK
jgi:hypothetical protein